MRPVNLIPPEERTGARKPMRGGPLAYIVVGALALALVGVTLLVTTSNSIADRQTEATTLEGEISAAKSQAESLKAYTEFHQVREQRLATITSLADSRFDWERVMRELSLVLPGDVWLTSLTASASPDVSVDGGGGSSSGASLRAQVPGPAIELNGCATGQDAVAGFVAALKDVDGVTRVGVESSELGEEEETEVGAATGPSGDECRTREFIAKFAVVVAFDAAPIPATGSEEGETAATTETAETSSETSEDSEGE
jgi:Tfp pilus assembly protein PilN